jgi:hypothetical protein
MKDFIEKLTIKCQTESGIRMIKNSDGYMEWMSYVFQPSHIITKIYGAWWHWLREIGVDTKEMLERDYPPVNFQIIDTKGDIDVQGHRPRSGKVWEEKLWYGDFNLEVSFQRKIGLSEIVASFVQALSKGFVTIGGGSSIGHGVIIVNELPKLPKSNFFGVRCQKGHQASRKNATFGGKCKCGASVKPKWAEVPESWNIH